MYVRDVLFACSNWILSAEMCKSVRLMSLRYYGKSTDHVGKRMNWITGLGVVILIVMAGIGNFSFYSKVNHALATKMNDSSVPPEPDWLVHMFTSS